MVDAMNHPSYKEGVTPIGKRIVLPSTYPGSPRAMTQNYLDAMALVRRYGKPDYFITMTANPAWPEITRHLREWETAADRPDLVARVFKLKLDELLRDLTERGVLGQAVAYTWVIEFQKRGLPHAHILGLLGNGVGCMHRGCMWKCSPIQMRYARASSFSANSSVT